MHGFHIRFDYAKATCKPATSNMLSARTNAGVVQAYLHKELALGPIVGPIPPSLTPKSTQISPIGVIPKSSQPGRWRRTVDLSSPEGNSVNEGNAPDWCSLQYLWIDDVVQHIVATGQGTLLA